MNMFDDNMQVYNRVADLSSRMLTKNYSTSFSWSIGLLDKSIRGAIYAIYGFVRLGDEIVDTFLRYDREALLSQYRDDTQWALQHRISSNPVLHNFQETVYRYDIDRELIDAFFKSMEMDLHPLHYQRSHFDSYVYGSAEVVGLMCLKVFCDGNTRLYQELKPGARRLGAAFQKVNFLRDIRQDGEELNRCYFPQSQNGLLTQDVKMTVIEEVEEDFNAALPSIRRLPVKARFGVYLAYIYYRHLLKKLKGTPPDLIYTTRIRVSNLAKFFLLLSTLVRFKLNRI
jgi:15-cis-phytoene synthase